MQTPGKILRDEREKKGLSIKDVEQATSIRSLYLTAIEEGNYRVVPGEVYLKGFIRNYGNFLGLDGQQLVDLYRQNQAGTSPALASQPSAEPKITAAATSAPPSPETKEPRKIAGPSSIWLVAVLVITAAAGAYWWYASSAQPTPEQAKNAKPAPIAPAQPQSQQPAPQTQVAPPAPPVQTKPIVITAKFTDDCWVLVTADGKQIFEGIPKAGDALTWEAQQNITLKLGNAAAADIIYNGQPQAKLGGKGEVVEKSYLPKR
ncbi:MAG: DUF4115 domain-containing protein [Negativicutes bacterium]|nr:DUF4115 domain-containing protein [Negativicutes bacterium]